MSLENAHRDRDKIVGHLEDAIDAALGDRTKHEPQLVANLVWHLPRVINNDISRYFKKGGVNVQAGGVFVHSQPLVTFENRPEEKPSAVEIGDLLLLMTYRRINGTVSRNALLLQAKKDATVPAVPDNLNQHHLYAFWLEFTYSAGMGTLNGIKRHVVGPHLYDGSKFLLIADHTMYALCLDPIHYCHNWAHLVRPCREMTAQPSFPELSGYQCFTYELYEFLFGNAGRDFIYQPSTNSISWDQVITDIMDITASNVSKYMQKAGSGTGQRGQGAVKCFVAGETAEILNGRIATYSSKDEMSSGDRPPEVPDRRDEEPTPNEGGLSVVEIVAEETGEGRRS